MKMFRTMMITAALLLPLTAAIAGPFEDGVAAYNKDNYETSVNLLWPLAEQGNASAQMWIGYMYDVGRGMPRSDVDAINWYKKAADQGNAFSQYRLGSLMPMAEASRSAMSRPCNGIKRRLIKATILPRTISVSCITPAEA